MLSSKKTFWLINQYASTPDMGMGGRHYYLAKELAKQGHKVFLIVASFTHLLKRSPDVNHSFKVETVSGFTVVWVKVPKYKGAHDFKRILNWLVFSVRLLRLGSVISEKPDAILYSSPSLFGFLSADKLSIKYCAKLAFEVRDIWPLTLIELGGKSPSNPLILLMQWIEDRAYHRANVVLSNLPRAVDHMESRGMDVDKFHWIPNGVDLDELNNTEPLPAGICKLIPEGKFVIGYVGTFGLANALEYLIDAARILEYKNDIAFVLVGDGRLKNTLIERAKGLSNISFIDAIDKSKVQSMLREFDVCFLGSKNQTIYRFGVAPVKLSEYMLASKPIIHSYSGCTSYVKEANAGLTVPAEDSRAIAEAVLQLEKSKDTLFQLGHNGKKYVLEKHDYAKLAQTMAMVLS